jgi:hypothetical protein
LTRRIRLSKQTAFGAFIAFLRLNHEFFFSQGWRPGCLIARRETICSGPKFSLLTLHTSLARLGKPQTPSSLYLEGYREMIKYLYLLGSGGTPAVEGGGCRNYPLLPPLKGSSGRQPRKRSALYAIEKNFQSDDLPKVKNFKYLWSTQFLLTDCPHKQSLKRFLRQQTNKRSSPQLETDWACRESDGFPL